MEESAMAQTRKTRGNGRAEFRRLVDLVQKEIDDGATSVEEIHLAIASYPLDVLEKLDLFEDQVKGARKIQEASIGTIYDLIRKANDEVAKFAKELLARRPVRESVRKITHKATRKASRTHARVSHAHAR
jgi:hypothetical protein